MNWIDTHSHIYGEQFDEDREQVVENALRSGVNKVLLPAIDAAYYGRMDDLVGQFPDHMELMAGLHPCSVKENLDEELLTVENRLNSVKNIAVGEIGLDLYWDKTYLDQQIEAFHIQCQWAKERNLPIVIHVRDAFDQILKEMDKIMTSDFRGVFHCFTGGEKEIDHIKEYENFYFGIGGVLTFKNGGLNKVVDKIPVNRLVLETDAPYLAPVPYRGKRNSTEYIPLIGAKLAEILGLPMEEVAALTTQNAKTIFNLD